MATADFRRQLEGFGLTTANILYRMPDHPDILQNFIWQHYDLHPHFPELKKFLDFWTRELDGLLHSVTVGAFETHQACGIQGGRRGIPAELSPGIKWPTHARLPGRRVAASDGIVPAEMRGTVMRLWPDLREPAVCQSQVTRVRRSRQSGRPDISSAI